jgi:hypothetical protein
MGAFEKTPTPSWISDSSRQETNQKGRGRAARHKTWSSATTASLPDYADFARWKS